MPNSPPFWLPGAHAARRPYLSARGRIAAALRAWFAAQDFLEVETAALQVSPGNETHLHAFATALAGPGGERRELYLRTSPEFACKKLLAAGEQRIVEFARVFRNRERGALHHPEFTLLEWYRAERALRDADGRLRGAAAGSGRSRRHARSFVSAARLAIPKPRPSASPWRRRLNGTPASICWRRSTAGQGDRGALAAAAKRAGVATAADDSWGDMFSRMLAEKVDPHLGLGRATILYEYPLPLAALARAKPGSDMVAERFELYACGVELANAFGELTDVAEQRKRFAAAMDDKERIHGERYPLDEDFLAALAHMPEASGIALGFDRLVMLATGAERIEQVIWTPVVEPE